MTHDEYAEHVKKFTGEMQALTAAKNADYSAGSSDSMYNFKTAGDRAGTSALQAWWVLTTKQLLAIERFVKDGKVSSESIHSRFLDMANYAMLGDALVVDLEIERQANLDPGTRKLEQIFLGARDKK